MNSTFFIRRIIDLIGWLSSGEDFKFDLKIFKCYLSHGFLVMKVFFKLIKIFFVQIWSNRLKKIRILLIFFDKILNFRTNLIYISSCIKRLCKFIYQLILFFFKFEILQNISSFILYLFKCCFDLSIRLKKGIELSLKCCLINTSLNKSPR